MFIWSEHLTSVGHHLAPNNLCRERPGGDRALEHAKVRRAPPDVLSGARGACFPAARAPTPRRASRAASSVCAASRDQLIGAQPRSKRPRPRRAQFGRAPAGPRDLSTWHAGTAALRLGAAPICAALLPRRRGLRLGAARVVALANGPWHARARALPRLREVTRQISGQITARAARFAPLAPRAEEG